MQREIDEGRFNSMKEYILKVKMVGDRLEMDSTNVGFEPLELVGILDLKRQDLVHQIGEFTAFRRTVETESGKVVNIEEECKQDSDCIIRHLTGECSYNETGCSGCKGRERIHDALDKQTPQLPMLSGDGYYDGELVYDTWECPHCGKEYEIDYDDYDYCPKCGQKINKSEMEGKSDE